MTRNGTSNLPEGLPARFVAPGTGFALLCDLLDIAGRRDQQKIVKIEGVKRAIQSRKSHVRSLSTSKRLQAQISTFYSLPHERRNLWQYYFRNVTLDAVREFPPLVSSLEYEAFNVYDSDFLHRELNETDIGRSISDFPGIFESISNSPEWQHPALAIWPELRCDLLRWQVLSPVRQDAVALATFAVATILDDVRFLDWAAIQSETLERDYAFALDENESDDQATPTRYEGRNLSDEDEADEIVRRWNVVCTAVAEIASKIGSDRPQPEHLDDLIEQVRILEDLREPMVAALDELHSEILVDRVVQAVEKMAAEMDVSWLTQYAGKIRVQWKLFFIAPGYTDITEFRQDVEQVERKLKGAMSEWQTAEHDMQSSRQQFQELEGRAHGAEDLLSVDDRKVEIQEEIVEATKRRRDARLRIFQVIAPGDQRFDPSKDYEQEDNDASVFVQDRTLEDAFQEPVGWPHREGDPEDEETTAPAPNSKDSHKANEKTSTPIDDDRSKEEIPQCVSSDEEEVIVESATSEPPDSDADSLAISLMPASDEVPPARPFGHGERTVVTEGSEGTVVLQPIDESGYPNTAATALWRAIGAGRPGIAYYIAELLTEQGEVTGAIPPAYLIAASALADHVHSAQGEVATTLRPLLESIDPDSLSSSVRQDRDAISLLLFCATLRPALFAPYTGATAMLRPGPIFPGR